MATVLTALHSLLLQLVSSSITWEVWFSKRWRGKHWILDFTCWCHISEYIYIYILKRNERMLLWSSCCWRFQICFKLFTTSWHCCFTSPFSANCILFIIGSIANKAYLSECSLIDRDRQAQKWDLLVVVTAGHWHRGWGSTMAPSFWDLARHLEAWSCHGVKTIISWRMKRIVKIFGYPQMDGGNASIDKIW